MLSQSETAEGLEGLEELLTYLQTFFQAQVKHISLLLTYTYSVFQSLH